MAMSRLIRPILLLAFVLAVPIVPFLLAGEHLEQQLENWLHETGNKSTIFWAVVAILSTDVLLPIPSSVVSTFAGWQLGVATGALASWLGMTAGAILGFTLARAVGRPLAERFVDRNDLQRMRLLSARFGPKTLVLCRALPVLAEASVLFVGAMGLSWPKFFMPTAIANLGIALAYSILGSYSAQRNLLIWAFAGSVALPLLATALVRRRLGRSLVEETGDGVPTVKPEQEQPRA
jgi:uncharacterized membrane protein YdjX (TVP38/TMEM64 family)